VDQSFEKVKEKPYTKKKKMAVYRIVLKKGTANKTGMSFEGRFTE